ncbi:hypothetical protein [uncultured Paludibaculum sp.]|uniref:hypothetical protein n=1 Tax=uncultured Paludibaculum sp. TaxID=1765020 RepID=UPI002AAA8154|nr:hypothetical protein [uncultured Paludibaculum sp.]
MRRRTLRLRPAMLIDSLSVSIAEGRCQARNGQRPPAEAALFLFRRSFGFSLARLTGTI